MVASAEPFEVGAIPENPRVAVMFEAMVNIGRGCDALVLLLAVDAEWIRAEHLLPESRPAGGAIPAPDVDVRAGPLALTGVRRTPTATVGHQDGTVRLGTRAD